MPVKDNGVAGVVSACVSRGVIERRRQKIYNLAFPFITPLRPDNNDSFGSGFLRHDRSYSFASPHLGAPVPNLKPYRWGLTRDDDLQSYAALKSKRKSVAQWHARKSASRDSLDANDANSESSRGRGR